MSQGYSRLKKYISSTMIFYSKWMADQMLDLHQNVCVCLSSNEKTLVYKSASLIQCNITVFILTWPSDNSSARPCLWSYHTYGGQNKMTDILLTFWNEYSLMPILRWVSSKFVPRSSALVLIMACCLFGAKPLPELMLTYCKLDPLEQTSMKFESKYKTFIM